MVTAALGKCIESILKYFENMGSSFKRSGDGGGNSLCCTVISSLEKLLLLTIGFAVIAGADVGTGFDGGGSGGSGGGDNCAGGAGGSWWFTTISSAVSTHWKTLFSDLALAVRAGADSCWCVSIELLGKSRLLKIGFKVLCTMLRRSLRKIISIET